MGLRPRRAAATGDASETTSTPSSEFYTTSGAHDVAVRYFDDVGGSDASFALRINGTQEGASWSGSSNDDSWKPQSFTDVVIHLGYTSEIDYVELDLRSAR